MKEIYIGKKKYPFNKTLLMGILNVTPDSFYDGGAYTDNEKLVSRINTMIFEGSDIIDIGGESTRPNFTSVTSEEEVKRILPALTLTKKLGATVSIDTTKTEVAKVALNLGADMINDISGVNDIELLKLVKDYEASICIMNNSPLSSGDIIEEITKDLIDRADLAVSLGIKPERIFIDPGIGFNKDLTQNLTVLKNLSKFSSLGYPTLLGSSRKSVIFKTLKTDPSGALYGTLATTALAFTAGINIIRVHDIEENKQFLKMLWEIENV